jgi:hypothetical protein
MRRANGQFEKGSHWRKPQAFRDEAWLRSEYVEKERSAGDIARDFGVTDAAILFWMRRFGIPRRTTSGARAVKSWGSFGADNPMWNRRGELSPNWKGGVTPERQAFYKSPEWRLACREVWARDEATCRRCGVHADEGLPMHVHHIRTFAHVPTRADPNNLTLVCEPCHHWIHSRKNADGHYLFQG